MAYRVKRKESVARAVRRLASERVEKAIEALHDRRIAWGIHAARKQIKQISSLLKLVRARIPKKSYRRSAAVLRKAAKHLAETRDSYVKLHALKALVSEERSHINP